MTEQLIYILFTFFLLAIVGWLIFLTIKYKSILKKAEIIFRNENSDNLSKMIRQYFLEIDRVVENQKKLESVLGKTKIIAESGLYKTKLLRYNPFGDVGSNQSFSLALLNKKNDGFVVTSIHSREGTRVYSKPVKDGESTYNLSDEEKKVILLTIKNNN